jgi:hypothetical protein
MRLRHLLLFALSATCAYADEPTARTAPSRPEPELRAVRLRGAGQLTTGLALSGLVATTVLQARGGELDRAYARIIGYTISTPILAVGATMWGVGDHRVRRVAVTAVPALAPSGAGVVLVGRW